MNNDKRNEILGERIFRFYIAETDRRIYKYFRLHKELLENEEYRLAYEESRAREIKRHYELFNDCTPEEIGEIKDMLYDFETKRIPGEIDGYKDEVMNFIRLRKRANKYKKDSENILT
ncbi:MAG: hypothetical protein J6B48_09070 [Clostridia bacterium]|nr:hypothetical protein [Clostridia bacterium]